MNEAAARQGQARSIFRCIGVNQRSKEVVGLTSLRKRMLDELRLRNLSEVTVRLYIGSVKRFSRYFGKSPEQLGPEQIREFLLHLIYDRKATPSTIQLYRSALRFFYVTMLKRSWFEEDVAHIKHRPKLPTVLGADEVTRILDRDHQSEALDHFCHVLYATGLAPVTSFGHLKVTDIDSQRMLIHVRHGKGRGSSGYQDLSPVLLERLRVYWRQAGKPQGLAVSLPNDIPDRPPARQKTIRLACNEAAPSGPALAGGSVPMCFDIAAPRHLLEDGVRICAAFQVPLLGHADIQDDPSPVSARVGCAPARGCTSPSRYTAR